MVRGREKMCQRAVAAILFGVCFQCVGWAVGLAEGLTGICRLFSSDAPTRAGDCYNL